MRVLSLDTTSQAGSVAVVQDRQVLAELVGDPQRTHGERLPGELRRALETAAVRIGDLQLLAVAAGPGSFTGLRVGIAAMQGLAMATGLRIVPVSALDALAAAAGSGADPIAAWIDAQRGQVFAALFDPAGSSMQIEPSSLTPSDTLAAWKDALQSGGKIRFIGSGALRFADVIRGELGARGVLLPDSPPLAGVIGLLAASRPDRAVLPHAVIPLYIRRPDAELSRLRRGSGA